MDFIGIIRSLEELLYEVMSWLIFYPRTLWRILVNPVAVTAYSDAEQNDQPDEQYIDTLGPPLLLMITMAVTYGLAAAVHHAGPTATTETGREIVGSAKNLLIMRAIIFATIPLLLATIGLACNRIAIDRKTLRRPFYSQCFLVTPLALMIQTALMAPAIPGLGVGAGMAIAAVALGWFLWAQYGWFSARLEVSRPAAFGIALAASIAAILTGTAVAYGVAVSV